MDNYLVTYEYKEETKSYNGYNTVNLKTKTRIFNYEELKELTTNFCAYEDYLKILFCQKL